MANGVHHRGCASALAKSDGGSAFLICSCLACAIRDSKGPLIESLIFFESQILNSRELRKENPTSVENSGSGMLFSARNQTAYFAMSDDDGLAPISFAIILANCRCCCMTGRASSANSVTVGSDG